MQTTTDNTLETKLSAIDKALAAAKARKAARAEETEVAAPSESPKAKKETSAGFAKAQKNEALALARAADKARRDAEREARRAAKVKAPKGPVHMKKIERAASRLPALREPAQILFTDITTNLPAEQVSAIALHLQHFNRLKSTERAVSQEPISVGAQVRIVGGEPKYIGAVGTVSAVRRIRCFVEVEGSKKPVYLFTSDVEQVPSVSEEAPLAAAG
jgi:hypothetical protein